MELWKTKMKKIRTRTLPGAETPEVQAYETEHAKLARRAAAEGFVLLKNENHLLPLKEGCAVALYGAGALMTVKGGTGSGDVNERYSVSVYEGLKSAGFRIADESWIEAYAQLYDEARQSWKSEVIRKLEEAGEAADFFTAYSTTPFYLPTGDHATATEASTAIYVLSRVAGENADRTCTEGDYLLRSEEHRLLKEICSLYQHVILLINTGGVVDLSFLDEFPKIEAVLLISQPGMEGGNAAADVISGKTNPSGKLTDTWAFRYADYPTAASFAEMAENKTKAYYREGIYVGYRYFDSFRVPARYSFGFGLSYTSFSIQTDEISAGHDGTVKLSVKVRNVGGAYAGREVVQVYAALPAGKLEKERRRLTAFAKTDLLAPGEWQCLTLSFPAENLSSYDEERSAWILEPGAYSLFVGNSLTGSELCAVLSLREEKVLCRTRPVCALREELEQLRRAPEEESIPDGIKVISYDLSALETRTIGECLPAIDDEAAALTATLGREQLIAMVTGDPVRGHGNALGAESISVPGAAGETSSCALGQGIANIVLADGPAGLRLNQMYDVHDGKAVLMPFEASVERGFFYEDTGNEGKARYQFCTAMPVGTLLAQSWDETLLREVGAAIGDEMRRFGVTLWLAPGMNIHRDPLCGRNFEYYSEDPLLSGHMAAAITGGVQSVPGCGTTIKHFCCNNQEDNRTGRDSVVTERALREIYLKGFEIAIADGHPWAIMTSYNLLNGVHTANCFDLCTRLAREEFGFDGFIMTDWTTTEQGDDCTAAGCIAAGNDLVMPGQFSDHENIRQALEAGTLKEEQLRACVERIVRVILKSDCYEE